MLRVCRRKSKSKSDGRSHLYEHGRSGMLSSYAVWFTVDRHTGLYRMGVLSACVPSTSHMRLSTMTRVLRLDVGIRDKAVVNILKSGCVIGTSRSNDDASQFLPEIPFPRWSRAPTCPTDSAKNAHTRETKISLPTEHISPSSHCFCSATPVGWFTLPTLATTTGVAFNDLTLHTHHLDSLSVDTTF
jgi:hypothetical protein